MPDFFKKVKSALNFNEAISFLIKGIKKLPHCQNTNPVPGQDAYTSRQVESFDPDGMKFLILSTIQLAHAIIEGIQYLPG